MNRQNRILALFSLLFLVPSFSLLAQEEEAILEIEEVLVTAQRREESLQDVPIAVTALSGDFLEQVQAYSVETLSLYTPSLHIYGEAVNSEFYTIRGVGRANEDIGSDSGVAVFIDDVYIARQGAANLSLYDIERVEVLRGPQGTLWGKNATGGAINIITRKPTDNVSAYVGVDVGEYSTMNMHAAASAPLSEDKVYGRIAIQARERDGLYTNLNTGEKANNIDTQSMRGSLRFTPSDATDIFLSADWERSDQKGVLKSVITDLPGTPYVLKDFFRVTFPKQEADLRSSRSGNHGKQGVEQYGANLTIQHELSFADFVSVTGYRSEDSFHEEDNDHAQELSAVVFSDQDSSSFSQEFRLLSRDSGALTWTAGLYWFHEDADRTQGRYSDFYGPGGLVGPGSPEYQNATTIFETGLKTDSYAIFGQVTWDFTEHFNMTFGGRYTSDKKSFDVNAFATPNVDGGSDYSLFIPDGAFTTSNSETWTQFTPKVVLGYRFSDSLNSYLSYTEGFKSGGFDGGPENAESVVPFEPEKVKNYELGLKGRFLDNRLSTDFAVFFIDFTDMQLQGFNPVTGTPITNNAAAAEIKGVEFEMSALLGDNLTFNLGASLLDHEFKDYFIRVFDPTIQGGPPFRTVDKAGDRIGVIPEYNAHVGLRYTFPNTSHGEWSVSGDWSAGDETITVFNTLWSNSYNVVDLRLNWVSELGNWNASLWMKNAFDEEYYRGGGPVPDLYDKIARLGLLADPRIFGVSFTWRYQE